MIKCDIKKKKGKEGETKKRMGKKEKRQEGRNQTRETPTESGSTQR